MEFVPVSCIISERALTGGWMSLPSKAFGWSVEEFLKRCASLAIGNLLKQSRRGFGVGEGPG